MNKETSEVTSEATSSPSPPSPAPPAAAITPESSLLTVTPEVDFEHECEVAKRVKVPTDEEIRQNLKPYKPWPNGAEEVTEYIPRLIPGITSKEDYSLVDIDGTKVLRVIAGHPRPFWRRVVGRLSQVAMLVFWVFGLASPIVLLGLVLSKHYLIATLLFTVMAYPYLFELKPWPELGEFMLRISDTYESSEILIEDPPFLQEGSREKLFCTIAPHGIFSWGFITNTGIRPEIPTFRGCISTMLNNSPIFMYFNKWVRITVDSSKTFLNNALQHGENIALLPGGFEEATLSKFGVHRLYLSRRKGFITLLLKYGYKLKICYTFGENRNYHNAQFFMKQRVAGGKYSIPGIIPMGLPWCPLLPRSPRMLTTFSKVVLEFPQIENPSLDQVNFWHARYIEEVKKHFDKYKAYAGEPDAQLIIV